MNTLYIYDMSAMIKSGSRSNTGAPKKPRKEYNVYSFPTGGLFTFNQFFISDYINLKEGDMIIACFDGKHHKLKRKEIYPDYKGNRSISAFDDNNSFDKSNNLQMQIMVDSLDSKTRESVIVRAGENVQLRFLRAFLPTIGVNVLYDETLEADDLIYSVAYKYGADYNIVLRGDDSDLADCKYYTRNNFKMHSVSARGDIEPVPNKNFRKIFTGEKGDNIPNLKECYPMYQNNLTAIENVILNGSENQAILLQEDYLKEVYGIDNHQVYQSLLTNYYVVSPVIKDVEIQANKLDLHKIVVYLSAIRSKLFLNRLGVSGFEIGEEVTNLQKFAFSLLPRYVSNYYKSFIYKDKTIDTASLESLIQTDKIRTNENFVSEQLKMYNIL